MILNLKELKRDPVESPEFFRFMKQLLKLSSKVRRSYLHLISKHRTAYHNLSYLGFVLNSIDVTISISREKHNKLCEVARGVLKSDSPSIREVAKLISMMVACFPGDEYGLLFYRHLHRDKTTTLKSNRGNFDATLKLFPSALRDGAQVLTNSPP